MKKREFLALGGAAPLMLAGCGSSSSGSCNVRLVNVSVGYPTLDLSVADTSTDTPTSVVTGVAYGTVSGYKSVTAKTQSTILVDSTASPSVNVSLQTRTLVKDTDYTLVAYGYQDSAKSVLITDNQDAPATGYASISVLNTATDVGAVDVYFTTSADITNATPAISRTSAVSASAFTAVSKGTYYVTVVAYSATGGTKDVRLQIPGVTLADGQIATLIIAPGSGGVLAHAVLLNKGGAAVNYRNTRARVRAIAATGDGGTINVDGVLGDTLAPGFSDYQLIAAGGLPAITVEGATVSYPNGTANLVAGADYTILVYGPKAAPLAKLVIDDNRLPSSSTNAKVRLLHAVYNATSPLTLKVNSITVASSIAYGGASTFTEVTGSTTQEANIDVKAGFTSVLSTSLNVQPNKIYTMVLAGYQVGTSDFTNVVSDFSAARLV